MTRRACVDTLAQRLYTSSTGDRRSTWATAGKTCQAFYRRLAKIALEEVPRLVPVTRGQTTAGLHLPPAIARALARRPQA